MARPEAIVSQVPNRFDRLAQSARAREEMIARAKAKDIHPLPQEPLSEEEIRRGLFAPVVDFLKPIGEKLVYPMAAVVMIWTAAACGSDVKEPVKPPSPRTVGPTATLSSETPTIFPPKTETQTPVATTVAPTEVTTVTPTSNQTESATPTESATASPTESETPTVTETPVSFEIDLKQKPFKTIFGKLDSPNFHWDLYTRGQFGRQQVEDAKKIIVTGKKDRVVEAFEELVNLTSVVLLNKQQEGNYPDNPEASSEYQTLINDVIPPFRQWLEDRFPKGTKDWQHVQDVLALNPVGYDPQDGTIGFRVSDLNKEPFSIWQLVAGKKLNEVGSIWPQFINVMRWRVASHSFAGFGSEIAGACQSKASDPFYKYLAEDFFPNYYYPFIVSYQPKAVQDIVISSAGRANCTFPSTPTPTPTVTP